MIKFERTRDTITPDINRKLSQLEDLPEGAYEVWRANTPRRTGNARSKTRLQGDTIRANYQYAVPLDEGSSRQAPQGMNVPTLKWLRQQLNRIMR